MEILTEYISHVVNLLPVLITLALVFVTYAIALRLHLSGPIAVVIAGLFIGNHGAKFAMSDNTRGSPCRQGF